jgi:hypothetical protein
MRLVNAKEPPDDFLRQLAPKPLHGGNILGVELALRVLCAGHPTGAVPAFRHHVSDVVSTTSDEQMVGVHAERRVASVQKAGIIRNGTVGNYPGKSVREDVPAS